VAAFFAQNLTHTKGPAAGQPFELEEWQHSFVEEFYRRDEEGRRIYRLGILGVPRGNGKSPLAAGLGLYELLARRDSPDVFCAAGYRDPARIVFNFARIFVETGPHLDLVKIGRTPRRVPRPQAGAQAGGRLAHARGEPSRRDQEPEAEAPGDPAFASWEEIEAIAVELGPRFGAIPIFASGTGMRPEEFLALERRDLDRRRASSPSSASTRTAPSRRAGSRAVREGASRCASAS
jgi:hypothetical protein